MHEVPQAPEPRYVMLTLEIACATCPADAGGGPAWAPLLGPARTATCPRCAGLRSIDTAFFPALLAIVIEDYARLPWDRGRRGERELCGLRVRYTYGRKRPRCAACAVPLPRGGVAAAPGAEVDCEQCGLRHSVAAPPDWLREACSEISAVYAAEDRSAPDDPASPVPFYLRLAAEIAAEAGAAAPAAAPRRAPRNARYVGPVLLALSAVLGLGLAHRAWRAAGEIRGGLAEITGDVRTARRTEGATASDGGGPLHIVEHAWPLAPLGAGGGEEPCELVAELAARGDALHRVALRVRCGSRTVYESQGAAPRCSVEESFAAPLGQYDYHLRCIDRSGLEPARFVLDTYARSLVLGGDSEARFEVRDVAPRAGVALFQRNRTAARSALGATRYGRALGNTGESCAVHVARVGAGRAFCRARVVCGERVLYGRMGEGYLDCTVREGVLATAADHAPSSQDGDPALFVDLANGHVRVRDDAPQLAVDIELDSAQRGGL